MEKKITKSLIIGLDGATWNALDDFVLDNYMPNLKKLKTDGYSGILKSTEPPVSPAAWTTCITGCHPPKHGVIGFQEYSFKEDSARLTNATNCLVPNMFQELSCQGYRVASVNVPWTYPCPEVNGIVVAGLGLPSISSEFTYPPGFKNELLQKIPDYEIMAKWERSRNHDQTKFESNLDRVKRSFEQRVETAQLISERIDWDVMMVQFHDLDMIQHNVWAYVDKVSRDKYPVHRDKLFKTLQKLDGAIGDILSLANSKELMVVVVSDHGFGKKIAQIKPNMMLCQWGYLNPKSFTDRLGDMFDGLRARLCSRLFGRESCKSSVFKNHVESDFDWARSKAAVMQAGMSGYLYLNVKGRQPCGCVEPDDEYANIVKEIRERFSELTNPVTGEALFADIVTPKELYGLSKSDLERFGDLILIPNPGYVFKLSSSRTGKCLKIASEATLKGTHYYEGIYLFSGPNIKGGGSKQAHIVDIAPTIYAVLGAKMPTYLDGKVLQEIFSKELDIQYQSSEEMDSTLSTEQRNLSTQEQDLIAKRLFELGYLD